MPYNAGVPPYFRVASLAGKDLTGKKTTDGDALFYIMCPDMAVSQIPKTAKLTKDLLLTVDRISNITWASRANLQLICPDIEGILHLIATVRIFLDGGQPVLCFQRLFTARPDMEDVNAYAPIEIYAQVLETYFGGGVKRGHNLFLGAHEGIRRSAMLVWCLRIQVPRKAPLRTLLERAELDLRNTERMYAARLNYLDVQKPWVSRSAVEEGRNLTEWDSEALLKSAGVKIISSVGMGGIATTWLGTRLTDGNRVVVKLFAPDVRFADIDKLRKRFNREYAICKRLSKYAVCPAVHEKGEVLGRPYFIQEYFPWPSLRSWLDTARAPVQGRERMLRNLAASVSVLHRCNTVHRDLTPSNVLVGPDLEVRIIDFGTAATMTERSEDLDVTLPGEQFGSLKYSAPEVRDDSTAATFASDVFSLGIIIYEAILGRNIAGSLPRLDTLETGLSRGLADFAAAAVSFKPEDRPRARELAVREV